MNDLCQRCKAEPRKSKERFCVKCGKEVRREARIKAWEMTPNPFMGYSDERGRKGRAPDKSPRFDSHDDE